LAQESRKKKRKKIERGVSGFFSLSLSPFFFCVIGTYMESLYLPLLLTYEKKNKYEIT
jgi:hypothetical protein